MTTTLTSPVAPPVQRKTPKLTHNAKWALGFLTAAVVVFATYKFVVPNLNPSARLFIKTWLPLNSVNEALIWVICALGLNIVVGYAGLLDLGYVAFWAIGGYTAGWLMSAFWNVRSINIFATTKLGVPGIHVSFWIVIWIAALVCAVLGLLIGAPTLRLKSDYLALVTLGFGEIIPQFVRNGDNIFGANLTDGAKGINPTDQIGIGSQQLGPFDTDIKFVIFSALVALVVFASLRIREGRLGRAWLAIREDELAASMMGVPLMRTKLAAYAVGAAAGGIGGVAYAMHIGAVLPDTFSFAISIILLAMIVLGGMGNVWGVMVGALGIAWFNSTGLPKFGEAYNEQFGTDINFPSFGYLIFGLVLVLMMQFRREGLFPESRTKLLLREPERTQLESVGADMEGVVE